MEKSDATLTVYGKPRCVQCDATDRYLKGNFTPDRYSKVDVSTDEEGYKLVAELGYQQVPVVVASTGEHWYGFVPDRLAEYV